MDEEMRQKVLAQLSLRESRKRTGNWDTATGKVTGVHEDVWGDVSGIQGDVSGIQGNVSEILNILTPKAA